MRGNVVGWGEERKMAAGEGEESPTDHSRQGGFGRGMRIATASVRTGFAMTPFQEVRWVSLRCVGEGLCPSHGRGNRRSAAGGRGSEPVSRKCPDWRPQRWPGIGWHDGGQENPAPTEGYKGCNGRATGKGRPYERVTRGAVRRADVGSELSAADGRSSEVSEWPRSKF